MAKLRVTAFLVGTSLLLLLSGCREVPTSVDIGSGPSFSLRGSGKLASFRIYGPQPGHRIATPFDSKSLVWRVEPSKGYFKGARVERLQIKYGNVPPEYTQTVPDSGTAPALVAGQIYYFWVETANAPPAEGFFYMDGMTPVLTKVPGLCQSGYVGDVKPLKCGTNESYVEPKDLEKFVQENKVH